MKENLKIKKRRTDLGLTESDICSVVGLTRSEYYDIELHEDEIYTVTPLCSLKRLCEALQLDLVELLELECAFCKGEVFFCDVFSLPRDSLIAGRRMEMGLTTAELAERIGFEEIEVQKMEHNPEHLETWPIDLIKDLAAVIDLPIQILLNTRCLKCGH